MSLPFKSMYIVITAVGTFISDKYLVDPVDAYR